jgi:hypothetical protein
VIVRVEPGGGRYSVITTASTNESDRITGVFGPFEA